MGGGWRVADFNTRPRFSMAASGLGCGKALVGTGYAISPLLCTNGLRKQSSGHVEPLFWLRTSIFHFVSLYRWSFVEYLTIESSLTSGCALSTGWLQWH